MSNIMNDKSTYVDDSLRGILRAHSKYLRCISNNPRAICTSFGPVQDKVSIITGGGYGHLPLFLGYVGKGLCDGCAVGNIFSPPSFDAIWAITKSMRTKAGILYLFGNYFNDSISFLNASEMANLEGIVNETVKFTDDISSGSKRNDRRGNAGAFFAYKITGACASEKNSLSYVKEIAERTIARTSTYGVMIEPCHLPSSPVPLFEMDENEIALGAGIHGERGSTTHTTVSSKELVELMAPDLLRDQDIQGGDDIALLVNGLGGATREDLYVVYNDLTDYLNNKGIHVSHSYVGDYATSMDTVGLSISMLRLDSDLDYYLDAPAESPFLQF